MNSLRRQYAAVTPFFVLAYFAINQIWAVSLICVLVLVAMCVYSDFYKHSRDGVHRFYLHVGVYIFFVFALGLLKFYAVFNTTPSYVFSGLFFVHMLYFFNKLTDFSQK